MRTIRRCLAVLLAMACTFAFASVLYASDESVAGKYDAAECSQKGTYYECEGEYLLLNENGSGEIKFGDYVYSLNWEYDDGRLNFKTDEDDRASGTLENGRIYVTFLDYDYVFVRNMSSVGGAIEASEDAGDEAAPPQSVEKDEADTGDVQHELTEVTEGRQAGPAVYLVTGRSENGKSGEEEGSSSWRYDYIALNDDGTGVFLFNNAAFSIRWEQSGSTFSFTDHLGGKFQGTMDSGRITGDYGRYRYTFEQTGETLPAYTLMPENWEKDLPRVVDEAGILSDTQEEEYAKRAQELTDEYDVGVYVVLVSNMDSYTWTGKLYTMSEELRAGYGLGVGATEKKEKHAGNADPDWKDSIVLTIAVNDREYYISAYGDYGSWAFSTYAREHIRDGFLDDIKVNSWSQGVNDFLEGTRKVLKVTSKGKQFSFRTDTPGRMIGFFVPLVLALLFGYGIAAVMRGSMQNTQRAQNAAAYVAGNKVNFTRREDRYIRTIVSRTYSPREKSSSGGGGGSFSSSSGGSHTGGSF